MRRSTLGYTADMRLTRATDLGLRVLMLLGGSRRDVPARATVAELAEKLNVPSAHLSKVVQRLQRLGLVELARGRGGGVTLNAGALQARVGMIVRALEPTGEVVSCAAPPCPLRDGCRLRSLLSTASESFYATLDAVALEDLLNQPSRALLALFQAS